jgi:hypothetical protein
VCLISADHPYRGARFTLDEFLSFGHAVIRAEGRSQEVFEHLLEQRHIQRRIVLSTPHFMAIPFVIARSDLVVTVPLAVGESFAEFANIRLVAPPLDIPTFDLRQHWHRHYHKDARSKWLRQLVAELFNGEAEPQYTMRLGKYEILCTVSLECCAAHHKWRTGFISACLLRTRSRGSPTRTPPPLVLFIKRENLGKSGSVSGKYDHR